MAELDPDEIEVSWSDERAERNRQAVHEAIALHRRRRQAAAVVVPVAAAAVLAFLLWPRTDGGEPPSVRSTLSFEDGSWARTVGAESLARIAHDEPTRSELRLERGDVEVDVVRNEQRVFEVVAGEVRVRVLGTRFFVERSGERVRVRVIRGHVRVSWSSGRRELMAGDSGLFPPVESEQGRTGAREETETQVEPVQVEPSVQNEAESASRPSGAWRTRAARNDFSGAYRALRSEGFDTVRNTAEDLMLAADVARLSGHPGQAVAPLRRILSRHRRDARAPLAAFTLGRVLAEDLGRPAQAAREFRRARSLAPSGPLYGDAMIREAEARVAAGQRDEAQALAEGYLERFPRGRHAARARGIAAP
ncbi:MAG: FecR domain-containing protein [Myxococcota bacterium]